MGTSKTTTLVGLAYVDGPLVGATITINDLSGHRLFERKNATLNSGVFIENIPWTWVWEIPTQFKIVITEGTLYGDAFNGSLTRYVHNYNQDNPYPVNALSTLIAAYMDHNKSATNEAAEFAVETFLEIPTTIGINSVIDDLDHTSTLFDSRAFVSEANAYGDFNAYVNNLASQVGQGQTHPFKGEGLVGGFGSDLFCFVGSGLANGAMSWVGGQVMGWAMGLLGFESADQKILDKLAEMSQKLDQMDQKLNVIKQELDAISNQLIELRNALNTLDQDLKIRISEIGSYDPISKIDTSFRLLDEYAQCKPGEVSDKTIDEWTTDVLSGTTGIPYAVDNLNKFLTGHVVGNEEGLLELMADAMINQLYQPGSTLPVQRWGADYRAKALSLYQGYQNYFEKFLYTELKGVTLIAEAHHARNETVPVKNYLENTWQPMLQNQINLFKAQVEKFVISVEINAELEFPNISPIQLDPDNQDLLQRYWQLLYEHSMPTVAQILPQLDHFADIKLNGTGRFIARVLVLPEATASQVAPADPKPVFQNLQSGTLIAPVGIRHTVAAPNPTVSNNVFYYYTYDLGTLPVGQYKLVSPTAVRGYPTYTGWYNVTVYDKAEWWSWHEGTKMSLNPQSSWLGYITVSNDGYGNPYCTWGGIWWDESL
jgi:hypothetical protein